MLRRGVQASGQAAGGGPLVDLSAFDRCENVNLDQGKAASNACKPRSIRCWPRQRKYKEYGIKEKPFVVVKADHGTHELGIVTVRDAKDMQSLQARIQSLTKGRKTPLLPHDFMAAEGVLTQERVNGRPWPNPWSI